ncbi:MAG TPA: ABC transporter ATP-binding protein [Pseudolabrys sp.]|jgi:putrescine transport system ATP-binding protein|nr:ABC transporter ATP-binding protein [Pseudolabrys sp.]
MTTEGERLRSGDVLVQFDATSKRFGRHVAVDRLTLDVRQGEFFALLGPSGCGKTTLLRLLAGFETPDEGQILLAGRNICTLPPHLRPVNMMFQNYALFPHLTVEGNIAFGLRQQRLSKNAIATRVGEMLELLKLQGLGGRRINELSGGQRQRVALARCLVKRPRVLLLDEPLAALDKKLRAETQLELLNLQRRLGTTFVIVTHDQEEAMILADRIGVMNEGRLMQVGAPADIYERPNSRWVAGFVGDINLIDGRIGEGGNVLESPHGTFRADGRSGLPSGVRASLAVRPEKIRIAPRPPTQSDVGVVSGEVTEVSYRGGNSVYNVRLADGSVIKAAVVNAASAAEPSVRVGAKVWLSWPVQAGTLLKE